MKTETIEAVYEHGSFRVIAPADLELAEGQKVRLVIEPIEKPDECLP
ncbi:MAG: antitoxin family protein [Phycisphaerae bacterium]|nr:antitoxin family protein [Phycisphaerae bacterium]